MIHRVLIKNVYDSNLHCNCTKNRKKRETIFEEHKKNVLCECFGVLGRRENEREIVKLCRFGDSQSADRQKSLQITKVKA